MCVCVCIKISVSYKNYNTKVVVKLFQLEKCIVHYKGRVCTNVLIALLACGSSVAALTPFGAWFQISAVLCAKLAFVNLSL